MTFGNLAALRQTNIVRMLAYSSIAQGGFMLVPFAAAGIAAAEGEPDVADSAFGAVIIYLLIYGAMNLGAFAVVIAVARRTASAEISSYAGLFQTSPGLVGDDDDLPGVARRYPAARGLVRQVRDVPLDPRGRQYLGDDPRGDRRGQLGDRVLLLLRTSSGRCGSTNPRPRNARAITIPPALGGAIALTVVVTVIVGIYPQLFARVGELAF